MSKNGSSRVRITVFSNYVCPFCYLEAPKLSYVRSSEDVTFEDAEVITDTHPYGGRIEAAVERVLNA